MSYAKKELRLYYTKGTSDKEYVVVIEHMAVGGYCVYAKNGRRGNATTIQTKEPGPVSLSAAERKFQAVVDEKKRGQYTSHWSGTPGRGIDPGDIVFTGTAPTAPAATLSPEEAKHLVAAPWRDLSGAPDIEAMLAGAAGTSAQILPAGSRVIAHTDSRHAVLAKDGKAFFLPDAVWEDLDAALPGFVLDGCYAAGTFAICDGFDVVGRGAKKTEPFAARYFHLEEALKPRLLDHVQLQRVFFDDDVPQGVYTLAKPGDAVLVRPNANPYLGDEINVSLLLVD